MITVAHPTTARHSILGKRSFSSPSMDGPKQGVLRLKSLKEKENLSPSSLPRLAVKKDPNQPSPVPVRKVSGSQPTLGAAALRTQVDTLRAENAKLRKDHQRELTKLQEKSSQSEVRIQELVREKLLRESEQAEAEREHRMAATREAALRTALERSEAALKQMNERTSKISGAERKLEDMERIYNDEKRKLTLEITSLQSQLEVARTTLNDHSARLRERDSSKRFESRARDLEARLQERESRIRELEEELATAEAQAQVYEGRVQVYDKRVRAYKERVRIAESEAREAESEIEALQVARAMGDEEKAEELDYAKGLMERLAAAYGELNERMQERDREVRSLEWALSDKEERARALERSLRMAEEERRELMEELDARRALSDVQEWSRSVAETLERDPRVELDELLTIAMDGQREAREMELEKLQVLARDLPRGVPPPPVPSTSATQAELELARLREECAALREEQESLEQDLVDAAMEAEGHARQAASFAQLSADYTALEAELARARAESAQPNTSAAHAQAQADLVRLESEHQRLKEEFMAYKSSMEDTARAAAEHEARAVLLNGLQAREFTLREQMGTLEAKIAKLEAVVEEERRKLSRAEERLVEARAVEDGLRDDMDEMMEALDRVDRYEEAYETLVKEIVQLGLGDDDLDRLEKLTEGILNVSTAKQKMKYVEQVKMDLDRMAQASSIPLKLARTEYERDQARAQGVGLHRELSVFKTVTGLNGWNNPARASSTPPVRNAMTPPARAPSTPLERITEKSVANPGPSSGARPELRALGLGRPPARPRSVMTTTSSNERRISRALSFALEAENMTLEE